MNMISNLVPGTSDRRRRRERRASERLDASSAPVAIAHESGVAAALCGDVSQSGLRLALDRPLAIGDALSIAFGSDTTLTGRVAWVEGTQCGVAFDQPIPQKLRGPRLARGDRRTTQTTLAAPRFRDGLNVTVMLPDSERKAVLRWNDDDSASITIEG